MIIRNISLSAFFICLILGFSYSSSEATEKTLGEIRKELLGKEVIIAGVKASGLRQHEGEEVFLEWYIAEGDSQRGYKSKKRNYLDWFAPYIFKGARGNVENIEVVESFFQKIKKGSSTDVFGDIIKDDDIPNPYIDIVVKLKDGTLLITRGYYNTIIGRDLLVASTFTTEKDEILTNMDLLIGKTIYPIASSAIFPPDADIKDIIDTLRANFNKLHDVPNLTPLKIIKVKYLENEHAILLKVEFLGNRNGIIFSKILNDEFSKKEQTFFDRATIQFLKDIPESLSSKEVEAIRRGIIIKGMSVTALKYSLGYPQKTNFWGEAGKELVYRDNLFVYIENDKVVDWQLLSR